MTDGINARRARPNAGTLQHGLFGASFAQELRSWWYTQKLFGREADIQAELKISEGLFGLWKVGGQFPSDPLAERLYSLSNGSLTCLSPEKRAASRYEFERKRGRSPQAASRAAHRPRVKDEELAACNTNPDLAFAIRGDDWIVCLECGRLLRQIDAQHLGQYHGLSVGQYRIGPDAAKPRYGPNRALLCNALKAQRSERAKANDLAGKRPDRGLWHLSGRAKGTPQPPEVGRKLRARARARNLERDTEVLRLWVVESKPVDEIADSLDVDASQIRAILRNIFGFGMKQQMLFSRGEPATTEWLNSLCKRFGLSKADLGELLELDDGCVHQLEKLVSRPGNRALTTDTAEPLVRGEGNFFAVLMDDEMPGDRADILRAVIPDLADKLKGASLAVAIARDFGRLKPVCDGAQDGNRTARIALAFLRSAAELTPTFEKEARGLDVNELVLRFFLPREFRTIPFALRQAREREGPPVTATATIREMLFQDHRTKRRFKELEAKIGGREATKRETFLQAAKLYAELQSWPKVAQRLDPDGYKADPRAAGERLRLGARYHSRD